MLQSIDFSRSWWTIHYGIAFILTSNAVIWNDKGMIFLKMDTLWLRALKIATYRGCSENGNVQVGIIWRYLLFQVTSNVEEKTVRSAALLLQEIVRHRYCIDISTCHQRSDPLNR